MAACRPSRIALLLAAATLLAAQPLALDFRHPAHPIRASAALAKDGGNHGGGSHGGGDHGGGNGRGGASGSAGSGQSSGQNGGDASHGGASHGGGGSGRSSSDRGGETGGSRGNGVASGGQGRREAGSGSGARQSREVGRQGREHTGRRGDRHVAVANGARVEVAGRTIELTTRDGFREEIRGARYEMKDPVGRTVVERAATAADRARLLGPSR